MARTGSAAFAGLMGLVLLAAACSGTRDGALEVVSETTVTDEGATEAAVTTASTLLEVESSPEGTDVAPVAEGDPDGGVMTFDSDSTAVGATGWAPLIGEWSIEEDPTAPSPPSVYAQLGKSNLAPPPEAAGDLFGSDYYEYLDSIDAYEIFPSTLMVDGTFTDVEVTVSYKPISGNIDQTGGIIFRAQGPADYYIFRCNVLEDDCRLWTYVDGDRSSIYSAKVGGQNTGEWQTVRVRAEGNRIRAWWNDREVMDFIDDTFGGAGQVGLWTKADAITYFDDFSAVEL